MGDVPGPDDWYDPSYEDLDPINGEPKEPDGSAGSPQGPESKYAGRCPPPPQGCGRPLDDHLLDDQGRIVSCAGYVRR